jgi:hypothetical protein
MSGFARLVVTIAVVAVVASAAHADVVPGDEITRANADQVKDLVSPGLMWCVKRGLPMTIVETKSVEWPKAYKEATEKYSGQVKLSADGPTVENYVAGQPFPNITPSDPQFAF